MGELQKAMGSEDSSSFMFIRDVEDIGRWHIRISKSQVHEELRRDLSDVGLNGVDFEFKFPDEYPFKPPKVRVIKPRFARNTGFVIDGALCMELLTDGGWSAVLSVTSIIESIKALLCQGKARLDIAPKEAKPAAENLAENEAGPADVDKKRKREDKEGAGSHDEGVKPENPEAKRLREERQAMITKEQAEAMKKRALAGYSPQEAERAREHIVRYHERAGWTERPQTS